MFNPREKYCLRWNDFENNLSSAFKDIKDDNDFLDVTLACGGNKQIQAHKVILAACSPFFRSVLKNNPHQHPLLYLKGVKYEEMLSVLDFMYHGEVNIAQNDLASFLCVAKELEVKGLTEGVHEETTEEGKEEKNSRTKDLEVVSSPSVSSDSKTDQTSSCEPFVNKDSLRQIKNEEPINMDGDPHQEISTEETLENNDYEVLASEFGYNEEVLEGNFRSEGHEDLNLDMTQGNVINKKGFIVKTQRNSTQLKATLK